MRSSASRRGRMGWAAPAGRRRPRRRGRAPAWDSPRRPDGTCPRPGARRTRRVSARTIEASEFPELSRRFGVQGVPRTVVNEQGAFVGALPEKDFVAAVLELAGVAPDGAAEDDTDV